ncbi:MAG: hypothetical protein ACLPX9_02315 [Rhodomicrobium sp.]
MKIPSPLPGLVLRYNYLWADDAARGREEGTKDRPAAIVMAVQRGGTDEFRVFALPVTHSPPQHGTHALEIPAAVLRAAGLDAERSWIVLSEFNEFLWPGFDLRFIPGTEPRRVAYGFLPPGFFAQVRDRWIALYKASKSCGVPRDDE